MFFAVERNNLTTALNRVGRIVRSNPKSVDILQSVKVTTYGDSLYLVAVSAMASVRVKVVGALVGEPGEFVVNYDKFRDRVSKAGPKVRVEARDGFLTLVSSDDQRLGLRLNDVREFLKVEWIDVDEAYGLDKEETINLFKLSHSITASASSLTPTFMQVSLRESVLSVSNGISYHLLGVQCNPTLSSTVPSHTLSALVGFMQESQGDRVWLSQTSDSEVVVTVGEDQFQASSLVIPFPDISLMINSVRVSSHHEIVVSSRALVAELSKAKASSDAHGQVVLGFEGQGRASLTIRTSSEEGDWYEGKVPCEWVGPSGTTMKFHLESLIKFLQTTSEDKVSLWLGDPVRNDPPPLFYSQGGNSGFINQFRI